jgi:hypothetical protein
MKKKPTKNNGLVRTDTDEILPEYDFSRSRPNKYAARYKAAGTIVVLDPELSRLFPDSASVNRALRVLADTATAATRQKKRPRNSR